LVVNATPVSLTGDTEALPAVSTGGQTAFVDLSYEPAETAWMAEQRGVSSRVANGKMMLVWQAKLQLDWWFDADIPISVLREAVSQ
jgi:shikimate 5-dehydrogenase